MEGDQIYYFVATSIASVFGFILAFIINRFVNKLDKRLDDTDRLFTMVQEEISELKKITAVNESRIEHLEDTVYKVRYEKKK